MLAPAVVPLRLCRSELLSLPSFILLTGDKDHQETYVKIICGTQKGKRESCWYISACLIKNNSRHYKVHVINMHMWGLWGRAACEVYFQQDLFPCEAGNNSESYAWEGKGCRLCTVFIPFCVLLPCSFLLLFPLPFPNGFCNYWKQGFASWQKMVELLQSDCFKGFVCTLKWKDCLLLSNEEACLESQ